MMPKQFIFGVHIDIVRLGQAVELILGWARDPGGRCRYVVTPNVNHLVLCARDPAFRAAYEQASLIVADGAPVVWASRLVGKPLPERVAGSDLVPALLGAAAGGGSITVFLLGAAPGVAERAAERIHGAYPAVRVVGTYSPPRGFERDAKENERILARVQQADPDVLVVGFGAPKQELWVHAHREHLHARVALCVGATIDFLAGERSRAPTWMRRLGLEWMYRVAQEPRRLAGRYARDGLALPGLVFREWRASRHENPAQRSDPRHGESGEAGG